MFISEFIRFNRPFINRRHFPYMQLGYHTKEQCHRLRKWLLLIEPGNNTRTNIILIHYGSFTLTLYSVGQFGPASSINFESPIPPILPLNPHIPYGSGLPFISWEHIARQTENTSVGGLGHPPVSTPYDPHPCYSSDVVFCFASPDLAWPLCISSLLLTSCQMISHEEMWILHTLEWLTQRIDTIMDRIDLKDQISVGPR